MNFGIDNVVLCYWDKEEPWKWMQRMCKLGDKDIERTVLYALKFGYSVLLMCNLTCEECCVIRGFNLLTCSCYITFPCCEYEIPSCVHTHRTCRMKYLSPYQITLYWRSADEKCVRFGSVAGKVILESVILTAVVVISLTLYTFWAAKRGHDFNFLGPFLFGAVIVLILFALIQVSKLLGCQLIVLPWFLSFLNADHSYYDSCLRFCSLSVG